LPRRGAGERRVERKDVERGLVEEGGQQSQLRRPSMRTRTRRRARESGGRGTKTHILAVRFRTATSFWTSRFSKIWGWNWFLRIVWPHTGQGSGPSEKRRSRHDSHLRARGEGGGVTVDQLHVLDVSLRLLGDGGRREERKRGSPDEDREDDRGKEGTRSQLEALGECSRERGTHILW